MTKRMIIMLVLVALVLGGVFGFEAFKGRMIKKYMSKMGKSAMTVSTMVAGYQTWQPKLEAVGSLTAMRGADLSSEVDGIVSEVDFKQGADVKTGTVLLKLDASDDIARLHALEAASDLAAVTYRRDKKQFGVKAISQQTLDTAAADLKQAKANVAQQQALVNKKIIRAPFTGRLGVREVDLGQYVKAGTAMVTLQSLDPIYVDFYLPQQSLSMIRVGQKVEVKSNAWPGETFTGTLSVIDPKVDTTTRNIKVRAQLKNPDQKLLPGMYATVDIIAGKPKNLITLPQTAVSYNPYGDIVYVVETKGENTQGKSKLIAKQVLVTTGNKRGDQVAILKGIKKGETVVTAGQIKLHNGSLVTVNNSIQPTDNPNPQPIHE